MDISEVTEYSRTSDANKTLLAEPPSQPKNESELFVDNSNSNITHTQCLPSSSNLGMFLIFNCKYWMANKTWKIIIGHHALKQRLELPPFSTTPDPLR